MSARTAQCQHRAPWFAECADCVTLERIPWKVVLAKMESLIRRKLIDGCTCGCRGDFHFIDAVVKRA